MKKINHLEVKLQLQIRALKLPEPETEFRFCALHVGIGNGVRQRLKDSGLSDWRFDFAWPDCMLAVEIEGGGWTNGRHTRGKGFEEDLQKYHHAMMLGWTVYRCDGRLISELKAVNFIKKYLWSK